MHLLATRIGRVVDSYQQELARRILGCQVGSKDNNEIGMPEFPKQQKHIPLIFEPLSVAPLPSPHVPSFRAIIQGQIEVVNPTRHGDRSRSLVRCSNARTSPCPPLVRIQCASPSCHRIANTKLLPPFIVTSRRAEQQNILLHREAWSNNVSVCPGPIVLRQRVVTMTCRGARELQVNEHRIFRQRMSNSLAMSYIICNDTC